MDERQTLEAIWRQSAVPVIHRPKMGKLHVRFPRLHNDEVWLLRTCGERTRPRWHAVVQPRTNVRGWWNVGRAHFTNLAKGLLERFGSVYVIQPHRELEICAPACQNAIGLECECSCLGLHHGESATGRWYEVSDALAMRWRESEFRWQLLVPAQSSNTRRRSRLPGAASD